jgi:hypothetical protein
VFSVLGLFFVVLFALAVLLWTGALGLQGLIYSEPAAKLYWRGPAAGAALTALIVVWCMLTYSMFADDLRANSDLTQLPLDTIFRFQPTQTRVVDKFWSVVGDKEILYRKYEVAQYKMNKNDASNLGAVEYRTDDGGPWSRTSTDGIVSAILVEEGTQKMRFEPKLARDKTFLTNEPFPGYFEVNGRHYMDSPGRVSIFNRGRWFLNILFNLGHFALWFLCLWLLLQFQWPHALGLAVVLWAVMTLVALPMLFDQMRKLAHEKVLPKPAATQAMGEEVRPRWEGQTSAGSREWLTNVG